MSAAAKVVVGVIIVTIAAAIGVLMLPPSSTADRFNLPLALSACAMTLHLGAAIIFLMSLSAYKATLRFAYGAISFSIVMTALGTIQLPLLHAFGLSDTFWTKSGLIALPFVVSGLAIYIGARSFSKLVGVQTVLARASLVFPVVIALMALSTLLPHPPTDQSEIGYDASNAILLWTCLLNSAAALIIFKISRHVGAHYTKATTWLAGGPSLGALIVGLVILPDFIPGFPDLDLAIDVAILVAGAVFLKAGYVFYRTREI